MALIHLEKLLQSIQTIFSKEYHDMKTVSTNHTYQFFIEELLRQELIEISFQQSKDT